MKRPTHKKCRQCGEWFMLGKYERLTRKFCTYSCASTHRNAQPKWKKRQSKMMKALADPEVMRKRAKAMWQDPEMRAHLTEKKRVQANSKEHKTYMVEHNKKLWADEEFRKRHVASTKKRTKKQWADPVYREKMSVKATEENKLRWADPDYKKRVGFRIKLALNQPLLKKKRSKISRELAQRPEEQARLSQMMKERWEDPEQRAIMSKRASETAKRTWSDPAFRKRKTVEMTAMARKPENRARLAELGKRMAVDPDYIARRKAWWEAEGKAKQIEANKKRWADPEYKARVSKAISEARSTPERKAVAGEASKKRWADPEWRARTMAKMSGSKKAKKDEREELR